MTDIIVIIIIGIAAVLACVFGFSGAKTEWLIIGIMVVVALILKFTKKKKG